MSSGLGRVKMSQSVSQSGLILLYIQIFVTTSCNGWSFYILCKKLFENSYVFGSENLANFRKYCCNIPVFETYSVISRHFFVEKIPEIFMFLTFFYFVKKIPCHIFVFLRKYGCNMLLLLNKSSNICRFFVENFIIFQFLSHIILLYF